LATPNSHLKELNPNFSIAGFPLIFETEANDMKKNSALTGVSSFGFGGTNGRSDLWSVCRTGHMKAGEVNVAKIGQIVTTCPITLQPIDYLTGEPATDGITRGKLADVLRDEFADYRISRRAYQGGFRYRAEELEEDTEDELKEGSLPYISGSWSNFAHEEMQIVPDTKGTYCAYAALGEGRYELFSISIDKKRNQAIFPAVNNANMKVHVKGPAKSEGECWILDGRGEEIKAGSIYKITLKLLKDRKEVCWELAPDALSNTELSIASKFVHEYYVVGSFNLGRESAMTAQGDGTWTCTCRIGNTGKEDFRFLRDNDERQAIYPAVCTSRPGVAACGPDNLGKGRFWYVKGNPGEDVTLRLSVIDAKVTLTIEGAARTGQVWENTPGWDRHSYTVFGSITNFRPLPMTMDSPGIFKAVVPGKGNAVDSFKVLVDGDPSQAFVPESGDVSTSGTHIVHVPGTGRPAQGKFVTRISTDDSIHLTLDLTAMDLRKTVTWKVLPSSMAIQDDSIRKRDSMISAFGAF
jgi:hypothetical protein